MSESTEAVHTRVDPVIEDPVGVSLQSTINDSNVAYIDPDKIGHHSLFEAKTLDIWDDREDARKLDRAYPLSRRLPDRLFDASHPVAGHGERLALRLLVTRPVLAGNGLAWHDDLGPRDHRQINYLPFTTEAVQQLIHQWDLPREYPWLRLNAREVGNFQRKTEWDFSTYPPRARRMGFVINFPFVLRPAAREDYLSEAKGGKTAGRRNPRSEYNPWRDDPFIWSFAMSHSLQDGKTRGLLDGLTDWAFGDFSRRILKAQHHWYTNPLHVPCVLLDVFFDSACWEVNRLCVDVAEFEDLSRDARINSLDKYDAITTELRYVKRNLDYLQNLIQFLLETLTFMEDKIFKGQEGPHVSPYVSSIMETNPHFEEKLKNNLHLIENNLETCEYLQNRTKDALDYINGVISLRDNESNRMDADANRTQSFLQLFFLPATFVAAIMSMNAFDFSKDPLQVYSTIWVFWVTSILLTVAVLTLYFGNQWYKQKKADKEQREAKEKEEHEHEALLRPPTGSDSDDFRGRRRRKRKSGRGNGQNKSSADQKPEAVV